MGYNLGWDGSWFKPWFGSWKTSWKKFDGWKHRDKERSRDKHEDSREDRPADTPGDRPGDIPNDGKIVVEAEDMRLCGYRTEKNTAASGSELIKLTGSTGYATTAFSGATGTYDIEISYVDENDGEGFIDIFVGGRFVGCIELDRNDGGNGVCNTRISTFKLEGIEIAAGAEVKLKGRKDGCEFARIDKIAFCPIEPPVKLEDTSSCGDADAQANFNLLVAGTQGRDVFETDVLIFATRAGDDSGTNAAMILNSSTSTGALRTADARQVLIISADDDPADPTANSAGGTVSFEFRHGADLHEVRLIALEKGGTIEVFGQDGELLNSFQLPVMAANRAGYLDITTAGAWRVDITLNGSGAVDDLCYDPLTPANRAPVFTSAGGVFITPDTDTLAFQTTDAAFRTGLLVKVFDPDAGQLGFGIDPASDGFGLFDIVRRTADTVLVVRNGVEPTGPVTDDSFDFDLVVTDQAGLTDRLTIDWSIG